jgi:nicotinate phosphoribosyltransferase
MLKTASEKEIKSGKVTDVYFERTKQILKSLDLHKKVTAEIAAQSFPNDIPWAIFSGLSDVLDLLKGLPVDIDAIPEGSIFTSGTPVISITGNYADFGIYETAILGLICQASGIATQAARCVNAAHRKPIFSFGSRRMHPSIATVIDRNAYIGGCTGVSTVISAEVLGIPASGTIPHALILLIGDTVKATEAFNKVIPKDIARISLVDTFSDEKFESLQVARALGNELYAVRLDTPSSRRGDFLKILKEVRWELDINGFSNVKLFISGGLNIESILRLNEVADAYGIGTNISSAKVIDFSMDIVEIDDKPIAKRGKKSGKKEVYIKNSPTDIIIGYEGGEKPKGLRKLTSQKMKKGRITSPIPNDSEIRKYVLTQIQDLPL